MAEDGSDVVRAAMRQADGWLICRIGLVETSRAIGLVAGPRAPEALTKESSAFSVVEIDRTLADRAASLALEHNLRTLDALHLAAALILPDDALVFATWDRRLHAAAKASGFDVLPESLT